MGTGVSKRITCPTCSKNGLTNYEFVKHYRESHNKQCTKCGLTGFETDNDMLKHYDEAHNPESSIITCRKCPEKFTEEAAFVEHIRKKHSFNASQISFRDDRNSVCPECGKRKRNDEKLQKHIKKNHEFECEDCEESFKTKIDYQKHKKDVHSVDSPFLKCPVKCGAVFSVVDDFMQHLSDKHNFAFVAGNPMTNRSPEASHEVTCPDCKTAVEIGKIVEHVKQIHSDKLGNAQKPPSIKCPHCEETSDDFESAMELLKHLKNTHNFSSERQEERIKNGGLPKPGDRILAMWEVSMWQYFHATIKRKLPGELRYEIDWDDGDTTGMLFEILTYQKNISDMVYLYANECQLIYEYI